MSFWADEEVYASPRAGGAASAEQLERASLGSSQLRKTRSMDASCLDVRSLDRAASPIAAMERARSDFNLAASTHSLEDGKINMILSILLHLLLLGC